MEHEETEGDPKEHTHTQGYLKDPSLWERKKICKEHRRLLIKFLFGDFSTPRRGVRVPKETVKKLSHLAKR